MQAKQFQMTITGPGKERVQAFANRVNGEWTAGATLNGKLILGTPAKSLERAFKTLEIRLNNGQ